MADITHCLPRVIPCDTGGGPYDVASLMHMLLLLPMQNANDDDDNDYDDVAPYAYDSASYAMMRMTVMMNDGDLDHCDHEDDYDSD